MTRRLVVEFTKMNGAGNDFVVVDNRFYHFSDQELSELARNVCRRRFGIGADGIMAFAPPRDERHHYRMRYINADGSIGTMCGNGARCLARFARRAGILDEEMTFETDAGVFRARVPEDESEPVRLFLSPPTKFQPNVSLASAAAQAAGSGHYIWSGTEHVVFFVPDVETAPMGEWGPEIRNDPALPPPGANVDFVEVAADRLKARTYEKGVEAETYACGTGAVAAAVTARLLGHIEADRIDVEMPGGILTVGFKLAGEAISDLFLEGPAEVVFRGTIEI